MLNAVLRLALMFTFKNLFTWGSRRLQATAVTQQEKICLPCRRLGDVGSVPGSGRSPGEGNGNPLQYSCLENSMDRGAWQATVHGVTKSQT